MNRDYETFVSYLRECADLEAALRLLEWDQETYMPSGAAAARARQIGALATLVHERVTSPDFLALVDDLAASIDSLSATEQIDVRETKWRLDRERALSSALVRQRSELRATARGVWIEARRDDDFARLAPHLASLVAIEQQVARSIDPAREPYEVLLEAYEPGLRLNHLAEVLDGVRRGLAPLVERVRARAERGYPASPLHGDFPIAAQRDLNAEVLRCIGFDFERGRIDASEHPFSTTIGDDVRLTTRYDEHDLSYALYSTLHEAGHGMYEQGLDRAAAGLPRGTYCSLGVHESQSRLWENQIGRSRAFCEFLQPLVRRFFPTWRDGGGDALYLAVNEARPSYIRTESDEITYNLHILLRYELERGLIGGSLRAADLAPVWRETMRRLLGIEPPTDREGVLQDVHWSAGEFGYFPTYTLGNLYAAQLLEAATAELGDLEAAVRQGEFGPLLQWLRRNVHRVGQGKRAAALIEQATGKPASAEPLLRHLTRKVEELEN